MTKIKQLRKTGRKYSVIQTEPMTGWQFNYKGKKYLPKSWQNIPEVLLEEYYDKIIKLENINENIKKQTEQWVETQEELMQLDDTIQKLVEKECLCSSIEKVWDNEEDERLNNR